MTDFEIYVFILCLFVFLLLTIIFAFVIITIVKMTIKMVRHGIEDGDIIKEKRKSVKANGVGTLLLNIFNCVVTGILCCFFVFSLYVGATRDKAPNGIPSIKVVKTGSMATKNEKNKYLFVNDINDQIQAFDLIITHHLPNAEDLKLYDVVVYSVNDSYVIHRIIGIEEPNEKHPTERYFLLQGDANDRPDIFPVRYEQMQGIYKGIRIPFVGSFILFMQSPAGWLCIMLTVLAVIATPVLEKKIKKEREKRLQAILTNELVASFDENQMLLFEPFKQKLFQASCEIRARYQRIAEKLSCVDKLRIIEGKKQRIFKSGNTPIVKFAFKGEILNAYVGLDPHEHRNESFRVFDVSDVKAHENYPMLIKLVGDQQTEGTIKYIEELCAKHGIKIIQKKNNFFEHLKGKKDNRTFKEKLQDANEQVQSRFNSILNFINACDGVRVIESKKHLTFKKGNLSILRLTLRGKTLNAFIGLNPQEYAGTKYKFIDCSQSKKHANYPMRVKLTSDRQVRWTIELLDTLIKGVRR